jgi:hypothetical protein
MSEAAPPPYRPQGMTLIVVAILTLILFCMNWYPRGKHMSGKFIEYEIYGFPFKIETSEKVWTMNNNNEVYEEVVDAKGERSIRILGIGFSTFNFETRVKWYAINFGLCFLMVVAVFGFMEFYLNLPPEKRFNFSGKPRKTKLERIKEENEKKALERALREAEALETKREMEAIILASDTQVIKKKDDPTQQKNDDTPEKK